MNILSSRVNPKYKDLSDLEVQALWLKNRAERKQLWIDADNGQINTLAIEYNDKDSYSIENELCARNLDY